MAKNQDTYPVKLEVDYPNKLDRFTTFFRLIWIVPIVLVLAVLESGAGVFLGEYANDGTTQAASIVGGLFVATGLMIVFRERYPKWWFDFNLEFNRFSMRIMAYLFLLTDKYPSTVEHQTVHLDIEYPEVQKDLNRWLPLVKWILALPHYIVLIALFLMMLVSVVIAWFAILLTGKYPKSLFDIVVGVNRYAMRVTAYAILLTTDKYPPFSLD